MTPDDRDKPIPRSSDCAGPADAEADEVTVPEGAECLGTYPSIAAYLRAVLESELAPDLVWILDRIDFEVMQQRLASEGPRLLLKAGKVYRVPDSTDDRSRP